MKNIFQKLVSVSILILGVNTAFAEQGDWIVRAGLANVDPDTSSDILGLDAEDDTQVGLTVAYMLTNNLGLELLAATPFEHTIKSSALGVTVGTAKQLPPTLNLQYYFLGNDTGFSPYAGVGLNYTTFFSEDTSSAFEAVAGDSSLSLSNSTGLSLQLGADFHLNDKWTVNVVAWKLDISTDARANTANLGVVRIDVDIDPIVYMIGLGYKF